MFNTSIHTFKKGALAEIKMPYTLSPITPGYGNPNQSLPTMAQNIIPIGLQALPCQSLQCLGKKTDHPSAALCFNFTLKASEKIHTASEDQYYLIAYDWYNASDRAPLIVKTYIQAWDLLTSIDPIADNHKNLILQTMELLVDILLKSNLIDLLVSIEQKLHSPFKIEMFFTNTFNLLISVDPDKAIQLLTLSVPDSAMLKETLAQQFHLSSEETQDLIASIRHLAKGNQEVRPLVHYAVYAKNTILLQKLISAGFRLEKRGGKSDETVLIYAVRLCNDYKMLKIILMLITCNANITTSDRAGNTCLKFATEFAIEVSARLSGRLQSLVQDERVKTHAYTLANARNVDIQKKRCSPQDILESYFFTCKDKDERTISILILRLLLTHPALQTASSRKSPNFCALGYAIKKGAFEIVNIFVETINQQEKLIYIKYALGLAIKYNQPDVFNRLKSI